MIAEIKDYVFTGDLEITDKVLITDPCYDEGTWCTATVDLPLGTYGCYVNKQDGMVAEMRIVKDGITDFYEDKELNGCGVDSGQLGIFNLNRFNKEVTDDDLEKSLDHDFPYEEWKRHFEEKDTVNDRFYKVCCNHTLHKGRCGVIDEVGFISSSGHGDGGYTPVLLKDNDNNIVGLSVTFIYK